MKRNSQKPNSDSLWMLRVLASQVILQLALMFLNMNHSSFLEKMKENRKKLTTKIVKDHRRKIIFLMYNMYPKLEPFEAFRRYEKFLGHDFLVKSIMALKASASPSFRIVFLKSNGINSNKTSNGTSSTEAKKNPYQARYHDRQETQIYKQEI